MAANKKLALVGYGKMGKLIEQLAPQHDLEVVLRLDEYNNQNGAGITKNAFAEVDVAIEFSTAEVAPGNIQRLARTGVQAVTGTTGWLGHLEEVTRVVNASRHGIGLES